MQGKIYSLASSAFPENIRYIGLTTHSLLLRLKNHLSNYQLKADTHKNRWIKQQLKSGNTILINPIYEADEIDFDELCSLEVTFIKEYKRLGFKLTNGTFGGEGVLGLKHSKGTKKILSEKAQQQWTNYSIEEKQRQSIETSNRLKGNQFRKGKKDPPERLISKSKQYAGKANNKWKGYIVQLDDNLEEVNRWESIKGAATVMQVSYKSLWLATWKKTKKGMPYKIAGFYWKYDKNEKI